MEHLTGLGTLANDDDECQIRAFARSRLAHHVDTRRLTAHLTVVLGVDHLGELIAVFDMANVDLAVLGIAVSKVHRIGAKRSTNGVGDK